MPDPGELMRSNSVRIANGLKYCVHPPLKGGMVYLMALTNTYVQVYGQLGDVFQHLAQAQAPEKFTVQYLKDLGFASTNFRAVVPLLKALGFLSDDGAPTSRYHEFRNTALSKQVMAAALRDAYGDLFTIRANPAAADRKLIEGKFRSTHNASPNTAKLMASTFYALLEMADLSLAPPPNKEDDKPEKEPEGEPETPRPRKSDPAADISPSSHGPTFHYNIEIHLPATKDVEVFNAIFKSLREHLLE
jgi:hypothetical protein